MRTISAGFLAKLEEAELTFLTRLWTISLVNGTVLRYCEATKPLRYLDQVYNTDPGLEISAIRESIQQGISDATITATISDDDITKEMVRFRDFDDAKVTINVVHSDDLTLGHMNVFNGEIIGASIPNNMIAEFSVRGTFDANNIMLGELYSERCRNRWGDSRCKVNTKKYEIPFEATHIYDDLKFRIDIILPQVDQTSAGLDSVGNQEFIASNGSGVFTVPNCTEFTVQIRAGGGAANGTNGPEDFGINDQDGEETTFGSLHASPGLAATKWEGMDNGSYVLAAVYSGEGGVGTGGDENGTGPNSEFVEGSGGRYLTTGLLGHISMMNAGGAGGYAIKTYQVGPDGDYQVGDTIPYSVGSGGQCITNDDPGADGRDGIIKVYSKNVIPEIDDQIEAPNQSRYGEIRWTSGSNTGRLHSVAKLDGRNVTIMYNNYYPIEQGDEGVYLPGCSNYRSMCKNKYDNLINFRAEPDVPNIVPVQPEGDTDIPESEPNVEVTAIDMGDALPYG